MTMTFGGEPGADSNIAVRNARYDSATSDLGREKLIISVGAEASPGSDLLLRYSRRYPLLLPFELVFKLSGMIPSDGNAEINSACSGVLTVLSRLSRTKANPTPLIRPSSIPSTIFLG